MYQRLGPWWNSKFIGWLLVLPLLGPVSARAELSVGAAAVDVSPIHYPVVINGGLLPARATRTVTPLHSRAIVIDDGKTRAAIVVVDTCVMPNDFVDDAKSLAAKRTKILPERMTISATHTHTAPAVMSCFAIGADENYVPYLREKIAESIAMAEANLRPARVGWGVTNAADYTALRRWIIRPDRVKVDPFGNPTVRANMHAATNLDDVTGESGPEDPDLSLIAFQSPDGVPIALLANFSMHYYSGVEPVNADYFGLFCQSLEMRLGKSEGTDRPAFVAAMSHGCSGDIWRRDYARPAAEFEASTIENYTRGLVELAAAAYAGIEYRDADLAMEELRIPLKYRVPDQQRLAWARRVVDSLDGRPPQNNEEVYAREQLILHELKSTKVVVQGIRIGEIGIAATSTETYALTGLKIKRQSPLAKTMVIELANGCDGYMPPPEQHPLGGYNTWAARSAGLEVGAEPKVAEAALMLLEKVTGQPRRVFQPPRGPAVETTLAAKPAAYFRLEEFAGPRAVDSSGHGRHAVYEPGVVFFLPGPRPESFGPTGDAHRCAHFAGGRIHAQLPGIADHYSISLWFWNGMPNSGRETAGWLFSRGRDAGLGPVGDHVGIGGTATEPGKLIYLSGPKDAATKPAIGRTVIERWTWNHLCFVREGDRVRLYLNGDPRPEIEVSAPAGFPASFDQFFLGGRCDNEFNWEGRLDEIAVFDRAIEPAAVMAEVQSPVAPKESP